MTAEEHPNLLEPALRGINTAARGHIVWQVRTHEVAASEDPRQVLANWRSTTEALQPTHLGALPHRVGGVSAEQTASPSIAAPSKRYRGLENQLHRIEIHHGGHPRSGATLKWSSCCRSAGSRTTS